MKNAAAYAAKINKLFNQLKKVKPKPTWPESDEPLDQLMLAILSEEMNVNKARAALTRLLAETVDLNELRVSTPQELALLIETQLPDALPRTSTLTRVLHAIYERENTVSLESLKDRGKRETRAYLESLDGATPYIVGCTLLWGLGDHAIGIEDTLVALFKKDELIDPNASSPAIQQFLERQISNTDAKLFTLVMKRYAAQRTGRTRTAKKQPNVAAKK